MKKAQQQLGRYATCTFDNFDVRWDAKNAVELVRVREVAFSYVEHLGSDWLYIYGVPGSGKTHLAAACLLYASEQRECRFWHVQDMLDAIKADKFSQQDAIMHEVFGVSLLVLDDLGAEHHTAWAQGILLRIITKRDQFGLPLIITSNIKPDRMEERLRNRILGRSIPLKMPAVNYREAHADNDWRD
jgi:DNA replication protein DnaC